MSIANTGFASRVRLRTHPWTRESLSTAWSGRAPALAGYSGAALLLFAIAQSLAGSPLSTVLLLGVAALGLFVASIGARLHAARAALRPLAAANERLEETVQATQHELRVSRSRIQAAADTERRRIELDIHDGAQQRIVGLRIKLELARETLASHDSEDAHLLDGLGDEALGILDELRSLARGVYPPVLSVRGPEAALHAAARSAPIDVAFQSDHLPRYSQDVEAAIYFCCLEAIQNAAKHGTAETHVLVKLSHDPLSFEVRDDGPGFDQSNAPAGTGLVHLRDRLAALDGDLQVISAPGRGTQVSGTIPT
ncbi:MAG TPA: ATP-binding protein [Baekduia sp.]|nr:ATP-binding protein [Baekduia sp.]